MSGYVGKCVWHGKMLSCVLQSCCEEYVFVFCVVACGLQGSRAVSVCILLGTLKV